MADGRVEVEEGGDGSLVVVVDGIGLDSVVVVRGIVVVEVVVVRGIDVVEVVVVEVGVVDGTATGGRDVEEETVVLVEEVVVVEVPGGAAGSACRSSRAPGGRRPNCTSNCRIIARTVLT